MKATKLSFALLAVCLAGATSANAGLTVVPAGVSPGEVIGLTITGSETFSGGVWAGVYNNIVNGVFTPGFCIDVQRDSGSDLGDYSYTTLASAPLPVAGPMGAAAATKVEQLWYAYFPGAESDLTGAKAAALQVAIWETVALGKGGYVISVDPSLQIAVNALFAGLSVSSPTADLIALTSPTRQNYVVPVPEPATIISGALLLLPFGASTLRILRRNRAA